MHGGAADRSGLIHVGDEVIEVNGINVEGKTPNDVLVILVRVVCVLILRYHLTKLTSSVFPQQNSEGTITFKLVPSDGKGGQRESKVRVRAHFDYNPETDPYIPCKEAGLGFVRGEVLHIVSQVQFNHAKFIDQNSKNENEINFSGRCILVASAQRTRQKLASRIDPKPSTSRASYNS